MPSPLAISWLTAAQNPDIAAHLEAIYTLIADQVEARQPVCISSGRCCHFEQHGHRLYVTGLEAAYTLSRLGTPSLREGSSLLSPLPSGSGSSPSPSDIPLITPTQIQDARTRGDCPYLINNLCSVHTIKPIGCRVYYCDPTAQGWQQDLSERTLAMVRKIHDDHNLDYRYGEWRSMLEHFT